MFKYSKFKLLMYKRSTSILEPKKASYFYKALWEINYKLLYVTLHGFYLYHCRIIILEILIRKNKEPLKVCSERQRDLKLADVNTTSIIMMAQQYAQWLYHEPIQLQAIQ